MTEEATILENFNPDPLVNRMDCLERLASRLNSVSDPTAKQSLVAGINFLIHYMSPDYEEQQKEQEIEENENITRISEHDNYKHKNDDDS